MKSDFLIKHIFSKKMINKYETKFKLLGSNSKYNMNLFLNIKIISLILLFFYLLFDLDKGYIISPIFSVLYYFGFDYLFLDLKILKREKKIEHDAIFFFEVLALTLQNEKNIKLCLSITSNAIDSELSSEVKYALKECYLGKSLTESLENLMTRIPSKTVNNVILNIIESNVYGNPIYETLINQIDYITDSRILQIKGQINKMPTKISIVSVLIFIPLVILLILGPVLINYFIK